MTQYLVEAVLVDIVITAVVVLVTAIRAVVVMVPVTVVLVMVHASVLVMVTVGTPRSTPVKVVIQPHIVQPVVHLLVVIVITTVHQMDGTLTALVVFSLSI